METQTIVIEKVDPELLEAQRAALCNLLAKENLRADHILWGLENMLSEMLSNVT